MLNDGTCGGIMAHSGLLDVSRFAKRAYGRRSRLDVVAGRSNHGNFAGMVNFGSLEALRQRHKRHSLGLLLWPPRRVFRQRARDDDANCGKAPGLSAQRCTSRPAFGCRMSGFTVPVGRRPVAADEDASVLNRRQQVEFCGRAVVPRESQFSRSQNDVTIGGTRSWHG